MLKTFTSIIYALSCALFWQTSVLAAPDYNRAVNSYNGGKYAMALSEFDSVKAIYPNNSLVRYYRALCLQSLGHFAQAKDEFQWVAEHGDARLKAMAQNGANAISGSHSQSGVGAATYGSSSQTKGKVKRILEFYADWCGACQDFAPVFDAVKSRTSGIEFQRYNVDDPSAKNLRSKYPFPTIPQTVFLDGNSNVLFNGNPEQDEAGFERQISQFR